MSGKTKLALVALLATGACVDSAVSPNATVLPEPSASLTVAAEEIMAHMDATNAGLAAQGADFRVVMAEYITNNGSEEAGQTVLQRDVGNKQLTADFVAGDPRRVAWSGVAGSTDDVTFAIDQTADALPTGGVTSAAAATAAIQRAMASWENLTCSTLPLTENATGGVDVGYVAFLVSSGTIGSSVITADVQHAGFRDLNFSPGILGVTYTFVFTSGGLPTDVDNNGKADVAFREIYYDPSWTWRINGNIDIESVALHEAGHGLSQAHFGSIAIRNDGTFVANPRAVMNAFYQAPFQTLVGTDIGGHCSNWSGWPNL